MFSSLRVLLLLSFFLFIQSGFAQCNGHQSLCDKRFNDVSFLTTHNAFNAEEDGFTLPNHTYGLTRQLNDGVRGLMIDVYDEGGIATVYHTVAFLGTAPLESNLLEIKNFLDANPREIVTIIFECYADFLLIETAFLNTGIRDYVHTQDLGGEWPTLQEMIDNETRLVVLSDRNDAPAGEGWYHYVWDYAVETPFSNNSNSDFTCEFNRGDADNDLFILNHFATDPDLGVGRTDLSELANEYNFFYNRARDCEASLGKFPNFPTIDFHEVGEPFRVVDSLNLKGSFTNVTEFSADQNLRVYPTISSGLFHFQSSKHLIQQVQIFNTAGSLVLQEKIQSRQAKLELNHLSVGLYLASVRTETAVKVFRLTITK